MKSSYINSVTKELNEALNEMIESMYDDNGSVITEKNFAELVLKAGQLKKQIDNILEDCVSDMCGKKVLTTHGKGVVVSYTLAGKSNRNSDTLAYKVYLYESKKEVYMYEAEITICS